MKILVATRETQGARNNDFCWTDEGEPVVFGRMCANSDHCGCSRDLTGLRTRKGTTTFKVAAVDMSEEAFTEMIFASERDAGFARRSMVHAMSMATKILDIAAQYDVGTVLERDGHGARPRVT